MAHGATDRATIVVGTLHQNANSIHTYNITIYMRKLLMNIKFETYLIYRYVRTSWLVCARLQVPDKYNISRAQASIWQVVIMSSKRVSAASALNVHLCSSQARSYSSTRKFIMSSTINL